MGRVYGYIRISSKQQNEDRQRIALNGCGVTQANTYVDKQSEKDFERPPEFESLRQSYLRGGITCRAAAERLGVSHSTFLNWLKTGKITAWKERYNNFDRRRYLCKTTNIAARVFYA